jgi:hypothetical protein
VILDVVRYMWMLAKSRTSCGIAKQMDCRFPLSRHEVFWYPSSLCPPSWRAHAFAFIVTLL